MNKQEAIEKIKKEKSPFSSWEGLTRNNALDDALYIVKKLDEPEKPVVPQYVADWLEVCKDNLALSLASSMNNIAMRTNNQPDKTIHWVAKNSETFAKAWIYGYEVEKEKLYLASFRDTNQYLGWNEKLGEWFMSCSPFTSGVEQTQETWEGVGIWNNPAFEIKKVEE